MSSMIKDFVESIKQTDLTVIQALLDLTVDCKPELAGQCQKVDNKISGQEFLNLLPEDRDADKYIESLNNLISIDSDAMKSMLSTRYSCSVTLIDHPTVQVICDLDENNTPINPRLGWLGIINGFLGIDDNGNGLIAVEIDETGSWHRICSTPNGEEL